MNFSSQIFFKDFDKSYSTDISKKNSLWLLPFFMAVATLCYFKGEQNDEHCNCIAQPRWPLYKYSPRAMLICVP